MKCPVNDSYGVEAGNRKLINPVGLLTSDETNLSGANWLNRNSNYYLYTNNVYWLLSPSNWYSSGYARVLGVESDGSLNSNYVNNPGGMRPAITIASSAPLLSGDGSQNDPYRI